MHERLRELGIDVEDRTGRAVALPESAQAVAAIVREARERGLVIAPHWLSNEGLPNAGESSASGLSTLHISRERMRAVKDVLPEDLMATVEVGIRIGELASGLAERGLFWPAAELVGSDEMLGDVIERAPGNHTRLGNTVRRYILMVEAILPDATQMRAGARTVKCVTGYDLKQLFIGSWQTLAVLTGATLRLEAEANHEAVASRLERDFAPLEAMRAESEASTREAEGIVDATWSDFLLRLKKELDPVGVFPPVETVGVES
jgi:FAD/FMN-containing dehydrogenase